MVQFKVQPAIWGAAIAVVLQRLPAVSVKNRLFSAELPVWKNS